MNRFFHFPKLERALEAIASFLAGVFEAFAAVVISAGMVLFISFLLAIAGIGMSMPPPLIGGGKLHFVSSWYFILPPAILLAAVVFVLLLRTRPKK